ncbi:MAG: hypothetical protein KKG67_20400 [Gammaproteobacteria bacterium]|nr:hypothetical protein [Gammaproteobacteria bacterium]
MATSKKDTPADAAQKAASTGQERTPMPVPPGGWPRDQYTGKPGSYLRDPYTGVRRPVDEPAAAVDPVADADPSTT